MKGTVARKNEEKGFGFIRADGAASPKKGEKGDVFFHLSDLQNIEFEDLKEGDAVEYELTDGEKGPRAQQIRVVD